jgi:hypothetical protein
MPPIMLRKKYGYTISATKGSNKIIACSKADWSPVKTGSFIVVGNDDHFYKIVDKNQFSFSKEVFVLPSSDQLKVNGTDVNLSINDAISFTSNEYKISEVSIEEGEGGSGYKKGDLLIPSGGVYKFYSIDGVDRKAELEVTSVGPGGEITHVKIKSGGAYSIPVEENSDFTGGSGEGAKLSFISSPKGTKIIEERTITNTKEEEGCTILYLDHPIPPRVKTGTITVKKWEISLATSYSGETKIDINYEILKDFTPNLELPLIRGDINSGYLLYNESISILDEKITELENRIKELES